VTVRFPVTGLDCAACGGTLRNALRLVPGVLAVAPNVTAQEVAVTFDQFRADPRAIRARLDSIGLCGR
jgi:copper chaperone CopZ